MIAELCSQCSVCSHVTDSMRGDRRLSIESLGLMLPEPKPYEPMVLVIDDYPFNDWEYRWHQISGMLGGMVYFTYTSAIRCADTGSVTEEEAANAIGSCSVWTRTLLENRKVILTTTFGLQQMGVKDKTVGDMFKVGKYGIVLVIPPLYNLVKPEFQKIYKPKIQRVLKEAGLL